MPSAETPYRAEKGIASISLLIVEDQQALATMLLQALKRLGFQYIFSAANGIEGMAITERERVDIILCDWVMEGMDGVTFTRLLRASRDNPNRLTPIIMMSGRTAEDDIKTARDSGITEFLAKPFTIKHICDRIVAVVEKPRDFVITPHFQGPDRRRRDELPGGHDRRGPVEPAGDAP